MLLAERCRSTSMSSSALRPWRCSWISSYRLLSTATTLSSAGPSVGVHTARRPKDDTSWGTGTRDTGGTCDTDPQGVFPSLSDTSFVPVGHSRDMPDPSVSKFLPQGYLGISDTLIPVVGYEGLSRIPGSVEMLCYFSDSLEAPKSNRHPFNVHHNTADPHTVYLYSVCSNHSI